MDLNREVADLKEKARLNKNRKMLYKAFSCIDLTSLNATDTEKKIIAMTGKVNEFSVHFPEMDPVAAICVYPNMASVVRKNLTVAGVRIAAVAGSFPSSMTFLEVKELEIRKAVQSGADDIDVVLPLWAFLEQKEAICRQEISAMKEASGIAHLKVILETGALPSSELIYKAAVIAMESGADFIKTSTGKMSPAATPEAAVVMCHAIRDYANDTGRKVGFKPAGGIATADDALLYGTIVREILGEEWLNSDLFRIGASRLANQLLGNLTGREISYF